MGDPPPRGRVRVLCRGGVASANSACARVRSFGLSSRRVCLRLSSLHATLYTLGDGVAGATLVPAPIVCRGVYGWGRWARAWPLRRGRVGGRLLAADQPDPERTGCQRRLALRARRRWHGRAARPGAFGRPVAASRCALGAGGAARPGANMPPIPDNLRALPVGGGDVEDVVRCALLEALGATRASSPAEGEGGEARSRHHDAQACGERLRAAAACAVRVGATSHWERERLPPRPGRSPAL